MTVRMAVGVHLPRAGVGVARGRGYRAACDPGLVGARGERARCCVSGGFRVYSGGRAHQGGCAYCGAEVAVMVAVTGSVSGVGGRVAQRCGGCCFLRQHEQQGLDRPAVGLVLARVASDVLGACCSLLLHVRCCLLALQSFCCGALETQKG